MKKLIMIISLALLATNARAFVQPIYDGENIWKLVERIALELDAIEDKANLLIPCCDLPILQGDIPYTITAPGVYCLAEDVSVAAGQTGVTVDSDCVVLNLRDHAINGQGVASKGVDITGHEDVFVKNGTIKKFAGPGINIDTSQNLKISNLTITESANHGITDSAFKVSNCQGMLIQECECSSNDISVGAFFIDPDCKHCVLRECIARGNTSGNGFSVDCQESCLIECKAFNTVNKDGFDTRDVSHLYFYRCIAVDNGDSGFFNTVLNGSTSDNTFDECVAASNVTDGFEINNAQKDIFRRCVASDNEYRGFEISSDGATTEVLNCSAIANVDTGIYNPNNPALSHIFANISSANGTQYWNVAPKVSSPDNETTYWTNVS